MRVRRFRALAFSVMGVIAACVGAVVMWFAVPFSPVKSEFSRDVERAKANAITPTTEVFVEEDFARFPEAIQYYVARNGFIGTPKYSWVHLEFEDVDFRQGKGGRKLKIDYDQYNFAAEPRRLALVESAVAGVPFQGYDYFADGRGGMKGVIGKAVTLFDERGPEMDKAALVTYLAESLFIPQSLLRNDIEFTELSEREVEATFTYEGITVSGVFTFNEAYEMVEFRTRDRAVAGEDGTMTQVDWTARCADYLPGAPGIRLPRTFQAVWNYPEQDLVYFDGAMSRVTFG
ncbi:DUF6544 family protein [Corynebacterium aurimucosum]|uniref:DUF6544 family protein n=1 Tax=Corynebacterium aurimucosum TaxID=169292 RepID=UPI000C809C04|nr:DUF6544 family protein [Corynebacterium aurimucosum]PMC70577.1 hypothetical protein CJ201_05865 [Corynebacterium aurimucosum]